MDCHKLLVSAAFVLGMLILPNSHASEADIKHRIAIMKALGGHMGAMAVTLRGEVDRSDQLPIHAQSLLSLASIVPSLFPEPGKQRDSQIKTRAKPTIWSKPENFQQTLAEFDQAAHQFAQTVIDGEGSSEQLLAFYADLGRACKQCHDQFRWKN